MKALLLALAFAAGSGTAGQVSAAAPASANQDGTVRVLFEYPRDAPYETISVVEVQHYRAGFREPTLEDAMPKVREKVIEAGGNAVIIRHQKVFNLSSRRIAVTAEILRVGEPVAATAAGK